jgi:hypothetical protein
MTENSKQENDLNPKQSSQTESDNALPSDEEVKRYYADIDKRIKEQAGAKENDPYGDFLFEKHGKPLTDKYESFENSEKEIKRLEKELEQAKEKHKDIFKQILEWLGLAKKNIEQVEAVRYIQEFKEKNNLSDTIGLAPLMLSDKTGRIEEFGSRVRERDFKPFRDERYRTILELKVVGICFYDELRDKIKLKSINETENVKSWQIFYQDKPLLQIRIMDDIIQTEWLKFESKNVTNHIYVTNALLFSTIQLTLEAQVDGMEKPEHCEQYCQLLKPGNLVIKPEKEPKFRKKKKSQSPVKVATIQLSGFDFIKGQEKSKEILNWLKEQFTDDNVEFDMKGFIGQYSVQESDSPSEFPHIVLTATSKDQIPDDIANAKCQVSLIKDDVELVLFANEKT